MAHPDKMAVQDIESQHPTDHDELESFFAGESPPHPHNHYSGRAPWLRAGVLGANDGARLSVSPLRPAASCLLPRPGCLTILTKVASAVQASCPSPP